MRSGGDPPGEATVRVALKRYTTNAVGMTVAGLAALAVYLVAPSATGVLLGSLIAGSAGVVMLLRTLKLRAAVSRSAFRMYRVEFGEVGSVNFPSTGLYTVFALLPEEPRAVEPVLGTLASTWSWRSALLRRASRGGVWATQSARGTLALIPPGTSTLYYARTPKTARESRRWRRALGI